MKYFLIAFILLFNLNVFSCINEYRTLLNGETTYTDPHSGKVWAQELDTIQLREALNFHLSNYQKHDSDSLEYLSDYAANLIYLGEYDLAIKTYYLIEAKSEGLYSTASNLGTAYELIGKNDSAYKWITKSMELYPHSHDGSEWIHLKILEFKLSENQNIEKSILGLDFGNNELPKNPNDYYLTQLEDNIRHQLRERLKFIKPKNEIVGNIYFDLGNILAQTHNVETAIESYELAKEFGLNTDILNQRLEALNNLARPLKMKENTEEFVKDNFIILFCISILFFLLFIVFTTRIIYKKMKNKG